MKMIEQVLISFSPLAGWKQTANSEGWKMNYNQVPVAESFRGERRLLVGVLLVGSIALVTTLLAGFLAPAGSEVRHQFAFSWLFAFLDFFTILIGCFFWIIVHHSTDFLFLRRLGSAPLFPARDPHLLESVQLSNSGAYQSKPRI
jgi:hypothetical protein